jgi:cytochrome c peroxidase
VTDDDQDDGKPVKNPPAQDEIEQYERDVRRLIRFRSAFDKHLRFLDDMLTEKESHGGKHSGNPEDR